MSLSHTRLTVTRLALGVGAIALLIAGADHLVEYAANNFSTVPTIGTLFLLNFIAATAVAVGLLVPLGRIAQLRPLFALSGVAIAASSLVALWISESSSLFGFTDYGFRPTIIVAICAEALAVVALSTYLARDGQPALHPLRRLSH
jgi:hypothetical protein